LWFGLPSHQHIFESVCLFLVFSIHYGCNPSALVVSWATKRDHPERIIINPVGLKNKIEQGKAGARAIEILINPNPDNCIQMLIYRIEHDNFNEIIALNEHQVLELPNRVFATLEGWIRESLSELVKNVLSLPPGSERDEAKRILKQRMDTLFDKSLMRTLYSVCRSLKILN